TGAFNREVLFCEQCDLGRTFTISKAGLVFKTLGESDAQEQSLRCGRPLARWSLHSVGGGLFLRPTHVLQRVLISMLFKARWISRNYCPSRLMTILSYSSDPRLALKSAVADDRCQNNLSGGAVPAAPSFCRPLNPSAV